MTGVAGTVGEKGVVDMSEWGVVGVIVTLVGFGVTVVKPLLSLNASIVKLTARLDQLAEGLGDVSDRNAKSHDRLWKRNEEQDAVLDDHERRITVLETHKGGNTVWKSE